MISYLFPENEVRSMKVNHHPEAKETKQTKNKVQKIRNKCLV